VGCGVEPGGDCKGQGCTRLHCNVLSEQTMDVVVVRPAHAVRAKLPQCHYHARLYIFYKNSLRKYTGRCVNDFTADG